MSMTQAKEIINCQFSLVYDVLKFDLQVQIIISKNDEIHSAFMHFKDKDKLQWY